MPSNVSFDEMHLSKVQWFRVALPHFNWWCWKLPGWDCPTGWLYGTSGHCPQTTGVIMAVCGRVFEQLPWRVKQASPARGNQDEARYYTQDKDIHSTFDELFTESYEPRSKTRKMRLGGRISEKVMARVFPDCLRHGVSNCLSMHFQCTSQSSHNLHIINLHIIFT
jgi:hypothetical protein